MYVCYCQDLNSHIKNNTRHLVARYNLWCENWNPFLTNLHLDMHEGILVCYLHSVPGWLPRSASSGLQGAWYYFWCENWNPDPNKHTFRNTLRHISVWPPYLYLAGLQDQPPVASKWLDINFDVRIEVLTLTNLHLDMHEGILLEFDLHICTWLASRISLQQPPRCLIFF